MIAKIGRGNGVQKLLWYLYGPGRTNEHINPHLVAAWSDDVASLEPEFRAGRHDVRQLASLLEQPLAGLVRPPTKTVWHCSLRLAPEDRTLTDAEWENVARQVLDRAGLAPRDDPDGCRWVAVRHADDHIHLAVTLARQDGEPAKARNDFYAVGAACRDLEVKYDLRRTPPRVRTGPRLPTRAETEKHQRAGGSETSRDFLRREVRIAAFEASGPDEFLTRLRRAGLLVRPRYSHQNPAEITGYSVARPGDHGGKGAPVWFGGSKLAADLSLQRLQLQWESSRSGAKVWRETDDQLDESVRALSHLARRLLQPDHTPDDLLRLTRTTISLAWTLARLREGTRGGPLVRGIDRVDRVVHALPPPVRPGARVEGGPASATARRLAEDISALARELVKASRTRQAPLADVKPTWSHRVTTTRPKPWSP